MSESKRRGRSLLTSIAIGLISAGVALGVAELIAGILLIRSPIIAVGDRAILYVPTPLKEVAISLFGTKDKLALLTGIFSTLALFAMLIGHVARRNFKLASAGVILICAVGLAAGVGSTDSLLRSLFPTPIGAIAGIAAIYLFRLVPGVALHETSRKEALPSTAQESSKSVTVTDPEMPDSVEFGRRRFLISAGALTTLAVLSASTGRWLSGRVSAATSRALVKLPIPSRPLASIPAGALVDVAGVAPFITPNSDFYRIDTALLVPQVPTDNWVLNIKGMVENKLSFTFDELAGRSDIVEADVTLTCVSNLLGGNLLGNARWLGVPVRNLLDEAGVDPSKATQIVGRSVDRYTCGFPTEAAYDGRTCLVAIGMNGEPLPVEHGFPARLVTAGMYGYVSATKWLSEIEMTTMESFDSYWVPRGYGKTAPIKTQSRIDVPKTLARVAPGPVKVAGFAWSQPRGIDKVEVRVDSGAWGEAQLADEVTGSTWRQWMFDWDSTPGTHVLSVRATDKTGQLQIDRRSDPLPDGATGLHTISVVVAA